MSSKTAIQGLVGSFHHQAAQQLLPEPTEILECATFREVFEAVANDRAEFGVVAIENSLHGSINPVYRLLAQERLWVCGEARLRIELFLIGSAPVELASLDQTKLEILSQTEALSQCENWLNTHLPKVARVNYGDTTDSVRFVAQERSTTHLAVAGKTALEHHGGTIVAGPINDDPNNYTRFFLLCKVPKTNPAANRTSIILIEAHRDKAGTLYEALGIFRDSNINLSKLDSHPLPGKSRHYSFYIDFDVAAESEQGAHAISQLKNIGWDVQVLGSYKSNDL